MNDVKPTVFTSSNDEGVERVRTGKRGYAFLMESTSIEYTVQKHCGLMQVGGLLDSKGYGIAMPLSEFLSLSLSAFSGKRKLPFWLKIQFFFFNSTILLKNL